MPLEDPLKLEFDLTDEQLDVLKEELIEAREVAIDKDGKMLVWTGDGEAPSTRTSMSPQPQNQPPASDTPPPEETTPQTADAPAAELPSSAPPAQLEQKAIHVSRLEAGVRPRCRGAGRPHV